MSDASLWNEAWAAYLRVFSAAPNLGAIVLLLAVAASTAWLLLFRPAPFIGAPQGDGDFSGGTPFWFARPLGERAKRLAAPIAMGLLRLALAAACVSLLVATALTHIGAWLFAVEGQALGGLWNDPLMAGAIATFALLLPLAALAVWRRFWAMGRRARLTIVDGRGDIGLDPWWIAEIGLRAGAPMTLRAGRGIGKSRSIGIRTDLGRAQIALPPDVRAALDLEEGERELVLLAKEPFPVWPAIPVALAGLLGFAVLAQLTEGPATQDRPAQLSTPTTPLLALCLTSQEIEDIAKICTPLLEAPLDAKDKAFVQLQIARMNGWLGDEAGALEGIDAVIKADPGIWQAYAQRAQFFAERRDYIRARADLDLALHLAPDGTTFQQRATLLDNAGQMPNGILDFTRALELAGPDMRGALLSGRAVSYIVAGQFDAALGDLKRAADYGVAGSTEYLNLGRAHFLAGRMPEASAAFEQAAVLDPGDAYAAIWLYLARQRAGQDGTPDLRAAASQQMEGSWQAALTAALAGDMPLESLEPGAYLNDDAPQLAALQAGAQACELNFYLGEKLLGQGDKAAAITHFQAALATGITEYIEYSAARNELIRLGATPEG